MGTRVCGKRCHDALQAKCRGWCGGTFHGAGGLDARLAFAGEFILDKLPTTEAKFQTLTQPNLFHTGASWRDRVETAVAAREDAKRA
jgi:hypothetical protein